jgi:hemolysin activation/secretion protein
MQRNSLIKKIAVWCLTISLSGLSLAVTPPPEKSAQPNDPQAGSIQRGIERSLPQAPLPTPGPEKRPQESVAPSASDVTVYVKQFRFEGVSLVSEAELLIVVSPWLNKTLNLTELNQAADAVSQFYQSKGFLAQAFIPPQKIESDGVVLIKVLEAKLGAVKIEMEGEPRFDKTLVAKYITYRNPVGQFVSTHAIEEAIYVINEIPGVAVTTELSPGEEDGAITLNVKAASTPFFSGSVTGSNFGSASTGKEQGMVNLTFNNPLGIGDQLSWNGFKTHGTNYHQASYSWPVHESGLRLGISASNMNYRTVDEFAGSLGTSQTVGMNLSYPLLRSQTTNANVTVSYDTKAYVNGLTSGTTNSQYTVHDLVWGFSGNHYDAWLGGGVSTVSLSVTNGVWHNALWDPANTSTNYGQYTAPRYTKFNWALTRNQQVVPDKTVLNLSLSGQVAANNLDTVERFFLGGPNGVRAYPQSQGSGDNGAMLNLEVQQQLPEGVVGYAFFDAGYVQQYKSVSVYNQVNANYFKAPNAYTLAGYGAGAKYTYQNLTINGFYAVPMGENPLYRYNGTDYVKQNNDGKVGKYFWLQAIYRF